MLILRLLDLSQPRKDTVKIAKILHRRLRETDEKGHLGIGRLGVILPSTEAGPCSQVLSDVLATLRSNGLKVDGEFLVYPDRNPSVSEWNDQGTHTPEARPVPAAIFATSYPTWKRALDIAGSVGGLMLASPLIGLFAILIRVTSPGPIFFYQTRTGYMGRPFTIIKLRTMVTNAEEIKAQLQERNERDGPAFKMRNDPRITSVGRIMRATGIDELPQLINVLRGDMALVGPRPLPVGEAAQCLPWQKHRQDIRPGLTCFWQLSKSRNIPFVDWMRLDLAYARSMNFGLDLRLIAKTFFSIFTGRVGH
ncbi:MAG: sugar transferase [Planctomycetales bacterium]|nr:sugar transferase [Planctomycetales bacterium]